MSLLFVIGCASDDGAERVLDFNDSNIKKIRNFYELYMDEHASVGPKNEATFKDYILNGRKANILKKKLNIDDTDVDGLFIGERDDEPFKIRYGLKQPLNHAIVFEATGVDGKRLVARSPIEELEADEYQAWLSGKKKPKPLPTLGQPMDESESAQ
jgi:hypothetical protein